MSAIRRLSQRETMLLYKRFMEHLAADPRMQICGVICCCGPNREPLACGFRQNHAGEHSWATLPTWLAEDGAA